MPALTSARQIPLMDYEGRRKRLSQLSYPEALVLAQEGKWEVNEQGVLRYLGMRGRGRVETEEIVPISYTGQTKIALIYSAPSR